MLISHVIPAFNSSKTIARTLDSVLRLKLPETFSAEAIIVDDGSNDSDELHRIASRYPFARVIAHNKNLGMCAGRNSGITNSTGDIVTILDSDDELILGWCSVLKLILASWPAHINICYAACRNQNGRLTVQDPKYEGVLTLNDILNERYTGEYMPLFRGPYVRSKPYIDLGMKKSCGIVSYINFSLDGPFWITNKVLRLYNEGRIGSITLNWESQQKARETVLCYQELLKRFGDLYRQNAPGVWRKKHLRLAAYLSLAKMPGSWNFWKKGASFSCARETVGSFFIIFFGSSIGANLVKLSRKFGLVRRYG